MYVNHERRQNIEFTAGITNGTHALIKMIQRALILRYMWFVAQNGIVYVLESKHSVFERQVPFEKFKWNLNARFIEKEVKINDAL